MILIVFIWNHQSIDHWNKCALKMPFRTLLLPTLSRGTGTPQTRRDSLRPLPVSTKNSFYRYVSFHKRLAWQIDPRTSRGESQRKDPFGKSVLLYRSIRAFAQSFGTPNGNSHIQETQDAFRVVDQRSIHDGPDYVPIGGGLCFGPQRRRRTERPTDGRISASLGRMRRPKFASAFHLVSQRRRNVIATKQHIR